MRCSQCQVHLAAHVHGELTAKLRWQVLRHLDSCEQCYGIYLQHRDLSRQMGRVLPQVGQATRPALNRAWAVVQGELSKPREFGRTYSAGYGLAALVVTMLLLIPLTMGKQNGPALGLPTQPAPQTALATPNSTSAVGAFVAMVPAVSETPRPARLQMVGPSVDPITTPE